MYNFYILYTAGYMKKNYAKVCVVPSPGTPETGEEHN